VITLSVCGSSSPNGARRFATPPPSTAAPTASKPAIARIVFARRDTRSARPRKGLRGLRLVFVITCASFAWSMTGVLAFGSRVDRAHPEVRPNVLER
jgi:hypothetical protein